MGRKSMYKSCLKMTDPLLAQQLEQFAEDLWKTQHYSELTADSYYYDIMKVCYRLHLKKNTLLKATREEFHEAVFVPYELRKTSYRALCAIKKFLIYLVDNGHIDHHPLLEIKLSQYKDRGRKLPRVLGEADTRALLETIHSPHYYNSKTDYAIRDKAIFELMYATGMRVSELANLKMGQIDLHTKSVRVIGKGNRERIVIFGDVAKESLDRYFKTARKNFIAHSQNTGAIRRNKNTDWVFIGRNTYFKKIWRGGKEVIVKEHLPLGRRMLDKLIKKYSYFAGLYEKLGNISCHWLRHSFATHLMNNGAHLRVVQMLLGHSCISSTQIYLHTAIKRLQEIHSRFHPRSNPHLFKPRSRFRS